MPKTDGPNFLKDIYSVIFDILKISASQDLFWVSLFFDRANKSKAQVYGKCVWVSVLGAVSMTEHLD